MGIRKIKFVNNEYYHICNRGVDKRNVFIEKIDLWRFIKGILLFNKLRIIGSIRDELDKNKTPRSQAPVDLGFDFLTESNGELVEIVSFCLNPNHYHLLVKQISDNGITKFMQKLGTGYTNYFNEKNKRSGVLFQGKFKAVHIESNEQLLYTSAYVVLNDVIHIIHNEDRELVFSSWGEYSGKNKKINFCKGKNIILDQFNGFEDYRKFAEDVVKSARALKAEKKRREDHLE